MPASCAGRNLFIAGHGRVAMLPSPSSVTSQAAPSVARRDFLRVGLIALPHIAALALMWWTEWAPEQKAAFILAWGLLNFVWLAVTRRPGISAALALGMIAVLILLSELKYKVLWLTIDFVDLMVIDPDSIQFLFGIRPGLGARVALACALAIPLLVLLWRIDPFRIRRPAAAAGAAACMAGLTALVFVFPTDPYGAFQGGNHLSHFARTGVDA